MKNRCIVGTVIGLCLAYGAAFLCVNDARAADTGISAPGLYLSPTKNTHEVAAGGVAKGEFTLKNTTEFPLQAAATVQRFSVKNDTYEYIFHDVPMHDWVDISQNAFVIAPHESVTLQYKVAPPAGVATAGHYFIIAASTVVQAPTGQQTTLRVAAPLYVTVKGVAASVRGDVTGAAIPQVVMGPVLPYMFSIKNTGSLHYEARTTAHLSSLTGVTLSQDESVHMMLPHTSRTVTGQLTMPVWPGIYTYSYGFTSQLGLNIMHEQRLLFVPPWSIAAFLLIIALGVWVGGQVQRARRRRASRSGR